MSSLSHNHCIACTGAEAPLDDSQIADLMKEVPGWEVIEKDGVKHLQRLYRFPDFVAALRFTNRVGEAAEAEDHHPALLTEWGKVTVTWWTHVIKGLHRNDFIMAAKTNELSNG